MSVGISMGILLGAQMVAGNGIESRNVPVLKIDTVSDFTVGDRPLQLDFSVKVSGDKLNVTDSSTFAEVDFSLGLKRRLSPKHRFSVSAECGSESSLGVADAEPMRYCGVGVVFDTTSRGKLGVHVLPYDERLGERGVTGQINGTIDLAPATQTFGAHGFLRALVGRAGRMRIEVGVGVSR